MIVTTKMYNPKKKVEILAIPPRAVGATNLES
jgi:hypothetical protein